MTFSQYNFKGKRALVRVDFNVPLDDRFQIQDNTRIVESMPTIQKILKDGGSVILMTHFGRPKEHLQSVKLGAPIKYSTQHLVGPLSDLLGIEVLFADDCVSENAYKMAKALLPGQVLLLENTRFYADETDGDDDFAQMLATMGDVYVNDAFGSAHRAHASTSIVANHFSKGQKFFGLLMEKEVSNAEMVWHNAKKPFTAIIGGAKVSDKIMILKNLLDRAQSIIIGGGMAYTFIKALGGSIGNSLVEIDKLDMALQLLEDAKSRGVEILLPQDSIVADAFSNDANTQSCPSHSIPNGWMGLDIGHEAIEQYTQTIMKSQTILWNGPMGVFEMSKFSNGTEQIAKAVAAATAQGAYSLIGGGDSVAAINLFHLKDSVSFVSTGGGALLEFFEGKQLPGIAAIRG